MHRQKSSEATDTWEVEERPDGLWVRRDQEAGVRIEHRVEVLDAVPVIVETRLRVAEGMPVPDGGITSAHLRAATLRGARDAAAEHLRRRAPVEDLRDLEAVSFTTRRKGEPRRWLLAITAFLYERAVRAGSRHPVEDVAAALWVSATAVRDRLYDARRHDPPLLGGGGRRGRVGEARLTDAGWAVLQARMARIAASAGLSTTDTGAFAFSGTPAGFYVLTALQIREAERRIPGLWEMELDEVAARAREMGLPAWAQAVRSGMMLRLTPEGISAVPRPEEPTP